MLKRADRDPGRHVDRVADAFQLHHLEAGRREELVAIVERRAVERRQHRGERLDRIARQLGIGDVARQPVDRQDAAQGAAPPDPDGVAEPLLAGRLADDAPVQPFAAVLEYLHHPLGAVLRLAFLVAGDQEGDGAAMVGPAFHEARSSRPPWPRGRPSCRRRRDRTARRRARRVRTARSATRCAVPRAPRRCDRQSTGRARPSRAGPRGW